ncbi:MAG: beta-phosphoglucomutase [Spirochaetes bacterium]|nr:beta-phosphoglucomutase [Spirochaetota bacterium]MBU1081198.1 beta-phosphoglucomutase [Spirochaetota bacterium]
MQLRAVLFDLDGVVADTASNHSGAWRRLAAELGWRFDDELGDGLRGIGRADALTLLAARNGAALGAEEAADLAARKNGYYIESLESLGPADILPGILPLLESLREAGVMTALASASRNGPWILDRLGLAPLFDAVADPSLVPGKPHPGVFLQAARLVGAEPGECVGVEDAQAGIDAIIAAGMTAVAVGAGLLGADAVVADTSGLTAGYLLEVFARIRA